MPIDKSFKVLKGTTFNDLFSEPEKVINPITEEEFLEIVVPVCYSELFKIVQDPTVKEYSKLTAINMLLDRAKGRAGKAPDMDPESDDESDLLSKLVKVLDIDKKDITDLIKKKKAK